MRLLSNRVHSQPQNESMAVKSENICLHILYNYIMGQGISQKKVYTLFVLLLGVNNTFYFFLFLIFFLRRDTAGKNIVFSALVNFEILCYFDSITCFLSGFWKEYVQNTHLSVYFTIVLSIFVCRFLLNSPKVSILT